MNETTAVRRVVSQFIKRPGQPLELTSLTVLEKKVGYGRKAYLAQTVYDVDLSRKYGYLFHESGFGGSLPITVDGIYHVHGDVPVRENPTTLVDARDRPPWRSPKIRRIRALNRTRRLRALPRQFGGQGDLLEWLERYGIQQDAVWCSECHDYVPGDELCDHCWWCEKIGWYSTPSERCGCTNREQCENGQ